MESEQDFEDFDEVCEIDFISPRYAKKQMDFIESEPS